MLILCRKRGESILVGNDIKITVTQVQPGGIVRIGVEAPRSVRVDREEVRIRIDREKATAA